MAEILRRKVQVPVLLLAVGVVLIVVLVAVILLSGDDEPVQGSVIDFESCVVVRFPDGFIMAQPTFYGIPEETEVLYQGVTLEECIAFAQSLPVTE